MTSPHNVLQTIHNANHVMPDPGASGAMAPDRAFCHYDLVSAAAETRTHSAPLYAGQMVSIGMNTDGGTVTITFAAELNAAGALTAAFDDVGDTLVLIGTYKSGALVWRIVVNVGVTIA